MLINSVDFFQHKNNHSNVNPDLVKNWDSKIVSNWLSIETFALIFFLVEQEL